MVIRLCRLTTPQFAESCELSAVNYRAFVSSDKDDAASLFPRECKKSPTGQVAIVGNQVKFSGSPFEICPAVCKFIIYFTHMMFGRGQQMIFNSS